LDQNFASQDVTAGWPPLISGYAAGAESAADAVMLLGHASASSAAAHPLPAAVIACR
jgi:hypothetical protein